MNKIIIVISIFNIFHCLSLNFSHSNLFIILITFLYFAEFKQLFFIISLSAKLILSNSVLDKYKHYTLSVLALILPNLAILSVSNNKFSPIKSPITN